MVERVLWGWRVAEGLTRGFWVVFEGGLGDLFCPARTGEFFGVALEMGGGPLLLSRGTAAAGQVHLQVSPLRITKTRA